MGGPFDSGCADDTMAPGDATIAGEERLMVSSGAVERVRASWSRAALDSTRWNAAVTALAEAVGAHGAMLFTPTDKPIADAAERFLVVTTGITEAVEPEYSRHWVGEDPWFAEMARRGVRHQRHEQHEH